MQPAAFLDLVSGRRRGPAAALARAGLALAEIPYAAAVRWRNRRFDRGEGIERVGVPVVSVGNLTLGGTGKTPLVEWLARWFRAHDVRVTIVSRGYGAEAGGRNDEALELDQRLPDVPHVQNPDRVAAARMAIEEFDCQAIVLDDAFQHRRLARDLDIVLIDALAPFGFGHVFPRGTLREPLDGLRRAHVVGLSRADQVDATARAAVRAEIERHAPQALWLELAHAPRTLRSASGREAPISSLAGKRVAAFCGIGNPAGFRGTLARAHAEVVALREFPDHHSYSRDDVAELGRWAAAESAEVVVCTHKDLVKLAVDELGGKPLWALVVELEILVGRDALEACLAKLLPTEPA